MTLKEQYENMSDEELIERYIDYEDYLLEAKIVILEELKKRGLKSEEEINQKLDKVKKEKIEKDKMNEEKHRKKKEKVDKVIKSKITMTLGIMSIISVISLIITLFAVSIYRTGKFEIEQKKEAQLKEQNKVNKINMWEKYPEAFIKEKNILNEIRNTIRNSDEKSTIKYENVPMDLRCYYDKTGREVYSVEHKVELSHRGGGKGATIRTRYYPEEKGVFYGENGIIKAKIEIRSSGMEYDVNTEKKEERRNFIIDGRHPGLHIFTLYTYDEKGKKTKEEEYRINYAMSDYIQTIRTYVDGKINKETVLQDVLNDGNRGIIIVDIEKNYDKNENLISKKVVRKNKNNSIWSETDFDLPKGEIITKYYERDKAFATVTETLMGKDKSIVKRERVGDDFVIWDFVNKKIINTNIPSFITDGYDRYITKKGEIIVIIKEVLEHGHAYNSTLNTPNGIDKDSFFEERISDYFKEDFSVTESYKVDKIVIPNSFNKSKIIYSLKEEFPLGSVLKKYNFKEEEIKEYIKNKNIEKESIFTIKEVIQNMGGKYEY